MCKVLGKVQRLLCTLKGAWDAGEGLDVHSGEWALCYVLGEVQIFLCTFKGARRCWGKGRAMHSEESKEERASISTSVAEGRSGVECAGTCEERTGSHGEENFRFLVPCGRGGRGARSKADVGALLQDVMADPKPYTVKSSDVHTLNPERGRPVGLLISPVACWWRNERLTLLSCKKA